MKMLSACLVAGDGGLPPDPKPSRQDATTAGMAFFDPIGSATAGTLDPNGPSLMPTPSDVVTGLEDDDMDSVVENSSLSMESRKALLQELDCTKPASQADDKG